MTGNISKSKGFKGDAGYTPQKGVDYWTPEDKGELSRYVSDLSNIIPLWQPNTEYKPGDVVKMLFDAPNEFPFGRAGLYEMLLRCKAQHISESSMDATDQGDLWEYCFTSYSWGAGGIIIFDGTTSLAKDFISGEQIVDVIKDYVTIEKLLYYGDSSIVPTDDSFFSFTMDDATRTASVTLTDEAKTHMGYIDNPIDIVIPYKCRDAKGSKYLVTAIGDNAFNGVGAISVVIPASVKSIGNGAFHNFSTLEGITIPSSVTSVSGRLFHVEGLDTMNLCVINCEEGSWIDSYAKQNKISTQYIKVTQNYVDEKIGDIETLLSEI